MREGNVFSLSTPSGGTPARSRWGGGGERVPQPGPDGGYPWPGMGYPTAKSRQGGTPPPPPVRTTEGVGMPLWVHAGGLSCILTSMDRHMIISIFCTCKESCPVTPHPDVGGGGDQYDKDTALGLKTCLLTQLALQVNWSAANTEVGGQGGCLPYMGEWAKVKTMLGHPLFFAFWAKDWLNILLKFCHLNYLKFCL